MALFFFNDPATTEIYTLSLHAALPICLMAEAFLPTGWITALGLRAVGGAHPKAALAPLHYAFQWRRGDARARSEEHTSELQSRLHLGCRLLLEKKKDSLFDIFTSLACPSQSPAAS